MPSDKQVSTEALLTELRRLAEEVDGPPTQAEMDAHGEYSSDVYRKRFASWNDALETAGLSGRQSSYTEEELVRAIRELSEAIGRVPTAEEMAAHGEVSPSTISRRFGSWHDGLRAAGLSPERAKKGYEYVDLIVHLRSLALRIGRPPTTSEVRQVPGPSPVTYERVFDKYANALVTAGFIGDFSARNELISRTYSREEFIEYVRMLAESTDGVPTWWDFSFHDGPDRTTMLGLFDSFQAALRAAEITVPADSAPVTDAR